MKTSTYLSVYVACESRKSGSTRLRPKGLVGIAVNTDGWAREWQRLDRISYKCLDKVRARLITADALAEFVELISSRLEQALDAGDISGRQLASAAVKDLNVALREYREAT